MQKKRLIALFLTVVLALSLFCVPTAAVSEDVTLTFSLTEVKGTEPTLELGLNVQTGDTEEFKSVGVVLEFDSSVLTLIPWDNDEPAYDLSNADKWSNAVPIGTKGIDEYMGSAAQAYKSGDKTYLYMSAEAINPTALPQSTRVATVRFAYNEGMSAENVTGGVTVKLADAPAIVAASPIQHGVVYHNDKLFYHYNYVTFDGSGAAAFDAADEDVDYLTAPTFEQVQEGESASGGGPVDPSKFVTVVCFDWDNTLLGSVVIPKGATEEEAKPYMDAFVKSLQSPMSKDVDSEKEAHFVDNEHYPLTYKRGYSFHTWLKYDSDVPTHCGRSYSSGNQRADIPSPVSTADEQTFGGMTENVAVKACYIDNDELYWSDDPTSLTYTLEVGGNSRIGTSANYIIKYRFLRQKEVEENGEVVIKGVPRMVEPNLRVNYNGNQYNFFAVDTSDEASFSIYPGSTVTSADAVMVDFYQARVLTSASGKSNSVTESSGTSVTDPVGFRHKGTLGLINEELAANSTQFLTAGVFRNAALTYTDLDDARKFLRAAWVELNTVDGELVEESKQKGLTFDQMNYAIANEGKLLQ